MGFGAFLLFCLVVLGLAYLAVAVIQYFYDNQPPAIAIKLIWGVALLIIFYTLATALGLFGHDVMIPRIR